MLKDNLLKVAGQTASGGGGGGTAEGVSFDGVTDYMSRSSDLVGNVDSKVFTFSCWYYAGADNMPLYSSGTGSSVDTVLIKDNGVSFIVQFTKSNTHIFHSQTWFTLGKNTWNHILISIDMDTQANCRLFLNDNEVAWTIGTFDTGVALNLVQPNHYAGTQSDAPASYLKKGRLSNLFLAYEYLNLDLVENRRLFITEDGKPAEGLASLDPILYLPMTEAATAHVNEGTGGDFIQNGLIETADRGANQDNCVASEFDGVDDYLSASLSNTVDTKQITYSVVSVPLTANSFSVHSLVGRDVSPFDIPFMSRIYAHSSSGYYNLECQNSAGTIIFDVQLPAQSMPAGKSFSVQCSFDLTNSSNRCLFINGVDLTSVVEWRTYTDDLINMTIAQPFVIGGNVGGTTVYTQDIGEIYLSDEYIDLAASNPFWDSEVNKPIPVRTAMSTLGSNPLICSPISADNPTENLGSGGSFTLNGGGLSGARGASEYPGRTIVSDASNKVTGSIFCKSLVKWIDNVVSYHNDVTITESDAGTVGYYFGFSDTIDWNLEASKNLVTNQLGYMRQPSQVISDSGWTGVLGLFFEDTTNFGLNTYGNDFSVTGIPTAGADITI